MVHILHHHNRGAVDHSDSCTRDVMTGREVSRFQCKSWSFVAVANNIVVIRDNYSWSGRVSTERKKAVLREWRIE